MRKLLTVLVGMILLIVAAVIFWVAHGPQSSEAATTGGKLYSQQEIAATGATTLGTVSDSTSVDAPQPLSPALAPDAAADLQSLEPDEIEAVQPAEINTIEAGTNIEVAPIAVSGPNTVAPPGGQPGTGGGLVTIEEDQYEQRVVELEWPAKFQVGRAGSLRIKLKVLDSGALQPVAEIADNEIIATPILITNRYTTHDAFVTLNISAPDFDTETTSPVTQQMFPGSEVEWRYTLESGDAQDAVIVLELVLSWQPRPDVLNPPPAPQNVRIWGQSVQVEVVYVFGLISVPQASLAGTVIGVMGLIAQYPLLEKFLEIFIDALFGGDRRDDRQQRDRRNRRTDSNRRNRRR